MALISLICLLAVSSSAFGRSSYGSFSAQEPLPRPVANQMTTGYGQQSNSYGSSFVAQPLPTPTLLPIEQPLIAPPKAAAQLRSYGSGYQQKLADLPVVEVLTEADILCRGKRPETIIPLEDNRRFVVCLDDTKGREQQCPKSLLFHPETRRCERRLGPLDNACSSQPCLNNGQCLPIDTSSFQCKCAPGFDGTICELDARVCQTQQPCGQAPGTRCQSFRASAAISYICIHQNEQAYGFSGQQVQSNPCRGTDGAQPIPITDKAFVMCDGERMFIESCPGGTIWDDLNKACVWPDMRVTIEKPTGYSTPIVKPVELLAQPTSSYGQEQPIIKQQDFQVSSYGQQQQQPIVKQQDFQVSSYGQQQQPIVKQQDFQTSSYGQQRPQLIQQNFQQPMQKQQDFRPMQQTSSY